MLFEKKKQQPVHFEWLPVLCGHCKLYGHEEENWLKKQGNWVWRPKTAPQVNADPAPVVEQPSEVWQQVGKRMSIVVTVQHETPVRNSFELLETVIEDQGIRTEAELVDKGVGGAGPSHG